MTDFASLIDMDLAKEHVAACSTLLDEGLPEALMASECLRSSL